METRVTHRITQQLKDLIIQGVYRPGNRLETERELCEKFGTSRRSIRSAISRLEQDGLLEKFPHRGVVVSQKAGQMIGVPGITHSLMFVRWTHDAHMTELTNGVLRMAGQFEDQPVIIDARCSHQRFLDAIANPPRGIRGMIVVPFDYPDYRAAVEKAVAAGTKIVFADRIMEEFDLSSVTADNFSGGYQATRHLIEMQDRPVYYIGYIDAPSSSRDRYLGYAAAMKEHGFPNPLKYVLKLEQPEVETTVFPQENWQESHDLAARLFAESKEDRYCLFAVDDFAAQGVYRAARKCGLTVGKNVFVVGFDDLPLCQRMDPPMSSVLQQREQMGYEAAKLLYQEISGQVTTAVHRVLPVTLNVRASSTG